jgi:signal transduction histidine kinase/ActR/RegA family two-component response regulator
LAQRSATTPLNVLVIDDSPDDTELMVHALRCAGYEPTVTRVDTEATMRSALKRAAWDVVLCDYTLPAFDAPAALGVMQECAGAVPQVIVSGTIGEERAAELMRLGAADVVLKHNVGSRLAPAVRRELATAEVRRRAAEIEQRFRDVAEVAGDWIWETGPDHRFNFSTGGRMSVRGKARWELVGADPARDPHWSRHKADLDARRLFRDFHYAVRSSSGKLLYVRVNGKPFFDKTGVFLGYRGTSTDETATVEARQRAEQAEEQLRQSQKMEAVGQLTGGVAHDFNNLLGVVVGNLELLQERIAADPESAELLGESLAAALRGADVTRQLLAFSRRQPLQPKLVEPNEIITGTSKLLARTIGEQIAVRLDLLDDAWQVLIDPGQLESALLNLAVNARDAMPQGGTLTIETANFSFDDEEARTHVEGTAGDFLMVAVSDTGTGMPPEILARVFEPFFSTKGVGKGTGLGLSMVYGLVKQSGGNAKIYSEPGRGTTVRLYLPRAPADAQRREAPEAPIAAAIGGERVLVVEDNEALRRLARRQLRELGYQIVEAGTGAEAVKVLESDQAIDLLFTDIVMPGGMDGRELARRAVALRPGLKALFMSGFTLAQGARADADLSGALISKPFRKSELALRIRAALDAPSDDGSQRPTNAPPVLRSQGGPS